MKYKLDLSTYKSKYTNIILETVSYNSVFSSDDNDVSI